jgi:DNA-binding protein YbaB
MTEELPKKGPTAMTTEAALRSFEDERRKLADLKEKMNEENITVRAKNRALSITFDGRGELASMKFLGTRFRSMAPAELAHVIVETVRAGRAQYVEKLGEQVGGSLAGVNFAELATGKADPAEVLESLVSPMMEEMGGIMDGVLGRPARETGK